jgi:type VI secretion system secreted protein VgrG
MAKDDRPLVLDGNFGADLLPLAARIEEGLSRVSEIAIDAVCGDKGLVIKDMLAQEAKLTLKRTNGPDRHFIGEVVEVEALGAHGGYALYRLHLRSCTWTMQRYQDAAIHQDESVEDIIDHLTTNFSDKVTKNISEEIPSRIITTKFFETDFDFLSRLTQEEGIYFFNDPTSGEDEVIFADNPGAHSPILGESALKFKDLEDKVQSDHVYAFDEVGRPDEHFASLSEYDFEKPKAVMSVMKQTLDEGHASPYKSSSYAYLGHYTDTALGERYARIRAEAATVSRNIWRGQTNVAHIAVGRTFTLENHQRAAASDEFLVTRSVHEIRVGDGMDPIANAAALDARRLQLSIPGNDSLRVAFDAIPATTPYRAPFVTPWPRVPGVMTAIVTGPSGEEIYTDQYGRVRLRFHWDGYTADDENATCWVRCMMPWTGKNWGAISIPRIGQEVMVQFEQGNPDRPIVVGMMYNADTMPPYTLPENKTQTGIKTNSSKEGGGFNELMFEDKKDDELVRFQAEKDYEQIVKNNATITVGIEKQDDGNLTMTVENDLTETINVGNHTFTVKEGDQIHTIEQGDQTLEVTEGKQTEKVKGNVALTVEQGNLTREVKQGNMDTQVKMGDYSLKTDAGSIAEEAMQEIELKVGSNSIKIDQTGITIKGIMVKIEGTAMLEGKAPLTQIKGDATLILKGGITMIN